MVMRVHNMLISAVPVSGTSGPGGVRVLAGATGPTSEEGGVEASFVSLPRWSWPGILGP